MSAGWATLRAHRTSVRALALAPDGLELLSGDDEGYVALWSLETRRPRAVWRAHANALLTTAFWPRGDAGEPPLLVTHARDNKLRVWQHPRAGPGGEAENNASRGPRFWTEPLPAEGELPARWARPWLLYTQDVNALNFCGVALGRSACFATAASTASERVDVYALDAHFALARPHRALDAADALPLDAAPGDDARGRRGALGAVMALAFANDADTELVASYEYGHVAVFDLAATPGAPRVKYLVQCHREPVLALATAGRRVFASAADRRISVLDLDTGRARVVAQLAHRGVASVDVLDCWLVAAGWDGAVRLFRIDAPAGDDRGGDGSDGDASNGTGITEVLSFPGGRQAGITVARMAAPDPPRAATRRLRSLPRAWIAVGGKDGRVGLFAHTAETTTTPRHTVGSSASKTRLSL